MKDKRIPTVVIMRSGMYCIGYLAEADNGEYFLENPRMIIASQAANGTVNVGISELLGKPEKIGILSADIVYEVTDRNIKSAFIESISKIINPVVRMPNLKI